MIYTAASSDRVDEIAALFTESFTASEGAGEGQLIGALARELTETTPPQDILTFVAEDAAGLAGAIMFTPLAFADPVTAYMLAPVAVATARQGTGIGQGLIAHGLGQLRAIGADLAITYGDPAFYGRVGFQPVSEAVVPAPHALSMPHGWLAQSLTDAPLGPLKGPCTCAAAFNDPAYW